MRPIVTIAALGIGLAPLLGSAAMAVQPITHQDVVRGAMHNSAPTRVAPTSIIPRIAKMFRLLEHPAGRSAQSAQPDGSKSFIYTCEYYTSDCRVFNPIYKPLRTLTQNIAQPQGTVADLNYARNTAMPQWKDKQAISKTYVVAIATGANGGADSFARVYGTSSVFRPQQTVTRAQAAVAVSVIGDHTFYGGGVRSADAPPAAPTATPT